MKPRTVAIFALALFASSAWLAWSTAARPDRESGPGANKLALLSPAPPQAPGSSDILAALSRELIAGPPAQKSSFSSKEMDAILSRERFEAACFYASGWAESDPAAMCEWIERRGFIPGVFRIDQSGGFVSTLFAKWADRNADAALAAALRLSRAPARAQALASSLQVIWRTDPDQARRVFAEHGAFLARSPEIHLTYDGVSHGPDDLKFLASLPAGNLRGKLLSLILTNAADSFSESSHSEATAFWKNVPPEIRHELAEAGFCQRRSTLIELDSSGESRSLPPFAEERDLLREFAETSASPAAARDFISAYGDSWAASDPAAAISWCQAHLKGASRLQHTVSLFKSAAHGDFDRAVSVWQALPPGILKSRSAGALISGTPEARKPEALALLDTLSDHDRAIAEKEGNVKR